MKATQLKSAPFALNVSYLNPAFFGKSESDSQRQFLAEEFEAYFIKFEKLLNIVQKEAEEMEEMHGYNKACEQLGTAMNNIEGISISRKVKSNNTLLQDALLKMPDDLVDRLFVEFCENPHLSLESDFCA